MNSSRSKPRVWPVVLGVLLLAFIVGVFQFFAPPNVTIPNPALPNPNGFDFAVRATQAQQSKTSDLDTLLNPQGTRLTSAQREQSYRAHPQEVEKWLAQNQPALQLLRKGLVYEYREPPVRGVTGVLPHYGGFRELARTLAVESNARAAKGDWPGAAQSALDGLQFGHQIPRGTPLIGALVGYAVQALSRRPIQEMLPSLDAPTCRKTARAIEKLHLSRVPYAEVLQEEKWNVAANLLPMLQSAGSIGIQVVGYDANTKKQRFRPVSRRRYMADFLRQMDALSEGAKQPYALAPAVQPPGDALTGTLWPVFLRGRFNVAKCESANTMLMSALALHAYRLEKGSYPDSLSQLAPGYIKAIPPDGFGAGEALRYKKEGANYRLWSIGPDKKDDGGKPAD
ncbi:MAG TPA: hypothetical protein VGB77_09035, partial [Abditibacteriaceae bacterium]